ncbi:MAG: energy-coupling factor ABC transporter permease, partial [Candidatus Omnitrophota bacterium]
MHIPNSMLHGTICPVTAVVSAIGVVAAFFFALISKKKPSAARFGAITALIFAGQMMNFPIQNGTSGHLLGGVLASALLGVPFGILSVAFVVVIQCVLFSDGGFTVLGANVLNMALIGAGLGGIIQLALSGKKEQGSFRYSAGLGIAAWLSIMMAALSCGIELSISGTIAFSRVAPAMLGVHALIGIGEGILTVAAYRVFAGEPARADEKMSAAFPLVSAGVIAAILSPLASGFPDGLEWVAAKYQFLHEAAPSFVSPLSDYAVSSIGNEAVSTGVAGLAGVIVTFLIAWGAVKVLG